MKRKYLLKKRDTIEAIAGRLVHFLENDVHNKQQIESDLKVLTRLQGELRRYNHLYSLLEKFIQAGKWIVEYFNQDSYDQSQFNAIKQFDSMYGYLLQEVDWRAGRFFWDKISMLGNRIDKSHFHLRHSELERLRLDDRYEEVESVKHSRKPLPPLSTTRKQGEQPKFTEPPSKVNGTKLANV